MNDLYIRMLTGLIFAVIGLGAILLDLYSYLLLLFALEALLLREYQGIVFLKKIVLPGFIRVQNLVTFILGSGILMLFTACSMDWLSDRWLYLLPAVLGVPLLLELFSKSPSPIYNAALNTFGLVYISIPIGLVILVSIHGGGEYSYSFILGLVILNITNDVFAYFTGRQFGRHKLLPRISPAKTWEGFAGGAVFTILAAVLLSLIWDDLFNAETGLAMAIIVIIFGTLGDLVESMLKRDLQIKDSGSVLPGHGGFLDRFDSLIFAIPWAVAYMVITG